MRLLMAIVRDEFAGDVAAALSEKGLGVTRISTTGGFWRRGNVTLLVGLDESEVDLALGIIDANAGPDVDASLAQRSHPPHRVTIFVLDVDSFAHY